MVYFGEYEMTVTLGGRIALPKKVRESLPGNKCVITKGFDVCLSGYDINDWERRSREFVERSLIDRTDMAVRRMIFSGAVYIEFDDQGRIVLPKSLVNYAGIQKQVLVIGVGDHFEIWDKHKWKDYKHKTNSASDELKHE